ncbi:MAG: NAD(P)H-dependent glycerol-3-phosphate dehydrogenase [Burkholderiales bacterium]|nr:NAD(P)H-dependent glycerol-3-phosphate dehydrogenase [Burkholderiales bacterium]
MTEAGKPVAVLGAGAWGTALACALAARGTAVLWARDPAQAGDMAEARRNARYLPDIAFPQSLEVTADLAKAAAGAPLLLLATPVAGLRDLLARLAALDLAQMPGLVWLCKGFERDSGRLPHEIVEAALGPGRRCGALSGPSFALEVARGLPCALTLAARDAEFARLTAAYVHGGRIRVYYSDDLVGVELGGALKNVIAIAVGLCDGLALGQNARAALITRGLAELTRLGVALGGRPETFQGLAGAGDLILTPTGDLSRNRRVGLELAQGKALDAVLRGLGHVAEGVRSAREAARRAAALGVDMPITAAVLDVLEARLDPAGAVERLLARDARSETPDA